MANDSEFNSYVMDQLAQKFQKFRQKFRGQYT